MISPVKLWRNQKKVTDLVGKTGVVISFTVIRVPPADFMDQAPYPVALVQLDHGDRITAQMVDLPDGRQDSEDDLMGMRVIVIVRRVTNPNAEGVIPYGIKVKPLEK